jgi:hypothetical protein
MPVEPWPEFRAALPERATIADAQAFALQGKNAQYVQKQNSPRSTHKRGPIFDEID